MYYDDKYSDKLGKSQDPLTKARSWWKARSGRDRFLIGLAAAVVVRTYGTSTTCILAYRARIDVRRQLVSRRCKSSNKLNSRD